MRCGNGSSVWAALCIYLKIESLQKFRILEVSFGFLEHLFQYALVPKLKVISHRRERHLAIEVSDAIEFFSRAEGARLLAEHGFRLCGAGVTCPG